MSDYSKLAFTSKYRYERIVLKGHADYTTSSYAATITITHNLGYVPYFKGRITLGDGRYYNLSAWSSAGAPSFTYVDNIDVTTTQLVITVFVGSFSGPQVSGTVYYRIYAES